MKKLLGVIFLMFTLTMAISLAHAENSQPADLSALLGEAIQDYNFQDLKQAEDKLLIVLKYEPGNPYAQFYLANIYYQTNRPGKAIPLLESVVKSSQQFSGDEELLAGSYLAGGYAEKALHIYNRLLKASPDNQTYQFQKAQALEKLGDTDHAREVYNKLAQSKGQFADAALYQIGTIQSNLGAYHRAVKTFRSIDKKSPYGPAAQAYIEALAPATRPLSISYSYEYFYNDNPGSSSATYAMGAIPPAPQTGSQGYTNIVSISSSGIELSDKLSARISYTYFETKHSKAAAIASNFVGHFVSPSISYHFSPAWNFTLKGDFQYLTLGGYHLSNNFGGGGTLTYTDQDLGISLYAGADYLLKRYNHAYGSPAAPTDMQYLDANSPTLKAGGSYTSASGIYAGLDYSVLFERTLNNTNVILNRKAEDSYFREHNLSFNTHVPLTGGFSRVSLDGSLGYTYRSYRSPQSGASLPSITPGNFLALIGKKASVKINVLLWKKFNMVLSAGADWTKNVSDATELAFRQRRFFGQISASY